MSANEGDNNRNFHTLAEKRSPLRWLNTGRALAVIPPPELICRSLQQRRWDPWPKRRSKMEWTPAGWE